VNFSKGGPSSTPDSRQDIDYAAELVAVSRAKLSYQANLRVLSTSLELDKEIIDHLP